MSDADETKILRQDNWEIPAQYADRVVTDRAATQREALAAMDADVARGADLPVAIWVDAQEIGSLTAQRCTPREFTQYLLRRLRDAGAPIEGSDAGFLRCAHGAVARLKPDPTRKEMGFRYLWLPQEHAAALFPGRV